MTQERRSGRDTEFGVWLRAHPELDSKLGFVATNIDYVWENYKTGEWMIIEEKRNMKKPQFYQERIFDKIAKCCNCHKKFCGFHVLTFERSNPEDGRIYWDGKEITKEELKLILSFDKSVKKKYNIENSEERRTEGWTLKK